MSAAGPRVSVVIPCYNAERVLGRALDSVLAQTRPADEIIVVDDGSSDGSAELVAAKYPQITLIRQENQGPAAARNAGLKRATGEFVAFLDADDAWLPYKLALQVPILAEHRDVGVVCGPTIWAEPSAAHTYAGSHDALVSPPAGYRTRPVASIFADHRIRTSAALVRRSACEQVGPLDESLRSSEDTDFFLRLVAAGWQVAYTRAPLTVGFNEPGRATANYAGLAESLVTVISRWDPAHNPRSPLTPGQFARARAWAMTLAGEYAAVGGNHEAARRYFRQGLECHLAPLWCRALCGLGCVSPGLVRTGAAVYRRLVGRRPLRS